MRGTPIIAARKAAWPGRTSRSAGTGGALTCAFALVMLFFMPMSPSWNVAMVVSTAQGIGTMLGMALVTVCLHLPGAGQAHETGASGAFG